MIRLDDVPILGAVVLAVSPLGGCLLDANFDKVAAAKSELGASCPQVDPRANMCGENGDRNCCDSPLVNGGTFRRSFDAEAPHNDPQWSATVADFFLDRYEVTVARYRHFLAATANGWRPEVGSGAVPGEPGSGWQADWDDPNKIRYTVADFLAVDCASFEGYELLASSDISDEAELKPMNCASWYEAFAFCVWDGGRLPSEAEWNYAAAGGDEQRKYPWGDTPPTTDMAAWGCDLQGTCVDFIVRPGAFESVGAGRWGQANLAGNLAEWTQDWQQVSDANHNNIVPAPDYKTPCSNCVALDTEQLPDMLAHRVIRGGLFFSTKALDLRISNRGSINADIEDLGAGIRCARDLP